MYIGCRQKFFCFSPFPLKTAVHTRAAYQYCCLPCGYLLLTCMCPLPSRCEDIICWCPHWRNEGSVRRILCVIGGASLFNSIEAERRRERERERETPELVETRSPNGQEVNSPKMKRWEEEGRSFMNFFQ